jgi:hypothetical protein
MPLAMLSVTRLLGALLEETRLDETFVGQQRTEHFQQPGVGIFLEPARADAHRRV